MKRFKCLACGTNARFEGYDEHDPRLVAQQCLSCFNSRNKRREDRVRTYVDYGDGRRDVDNVDERLRSGHAMMSLNRGSRAFDLPWLQAIPSCQRAE